jgi:DNA-binding response OmpR family regulator
MPDRGKRILIVEDEESIRQLLHTALTDSGYLILEANNGLEGWDKFEIESPDMVILDIMMPGMNGLQLCSKIREKSDIPIIMLTALGTSENIVLGLDMGADDYLTKPFKYTELIARVRALLRRTGKTDSETQTHIFRFDDVELNDLEKTVKRNGKLLSLTSTEYRLLMMFMEYPKKVFSRLEILERVWGVDYSMGTNVVDVYVNYLRKKLESNGGTKLIHTLIGHGYVMREES